jgi:hypothetical protein
MYGHDILFTNGVEWHTAHVLAVCRDADDGFALQPVHACFARDQHGQVSILLNNSTRPMMAQANRRFALQQSAPAATTLKITCFSPDKRYGFLLPGNAE